MSEQAQTIVFVDVEVGFTSHKLQDIGAIRHDGSVFHSTNTLAFTQFVSQCRYVCGHNILQHDAKYIPLPPHIAIIDTLYLSPLLFPRKPYHKLLKDDKLLSEELNNPINDCRKAQSLFFDELEAFRELPPPQQQILGTLLMPCEAFSAFFQYIDFCPTTPSITDLISETYAGKICSHADLSMLATHYPIELAYALALISTNDSLSITPGWVLHQFPKIQNLMIYLRSTPCEEGCDYCRQHLNIHQNLYNIFGYKQFRTYDGEPLQEQATQAAVSGKSLLAIFPTGGGKSLTFQLPALMAGNNTHGLTVVISPLQSLMKDQVDNLVEKGISSAVTINGLLDPIERSHAIERVAEGTASLLYISPEMLRSKTIERLLLNRNIVRFVIDEAHCFSAWGQDFRVDYLYIGQFIRHLQQIKQSRHPIPVSCFTATAKQKVVSDICDYFKTTLGIELQIFASKSTRKNLHYAVIHAETEEEKYNLLRGMISENPCPTIIYVSRTRKSIELAHKLTNDGFRALPFNGKMEVEQKVANQNAFMQNEVNIIVATSAFGMGVDKSDVGMVLHYDISDSLENYVQEAGRAGRDPKMQAQCFVLYSDNDLDKHFILLNQTKLSLSEIQQVWRAIKELTRQREHVNCSPLDVARQAGWDESVTDREGRVRTAIAALEQAGYIQRGNNIPHIYATSICVNNMQEAHQRILKSSLFSQTERNDAIRIIKSLISNKHVTKAQDAEAESRVDYLSDILGLTNSTVISILQRMRQEGILSDMRDISVFFPSGESAARPRNIFHKYARLEQFLLNNISDNGESLNIRQLNDKAILAGINTATVQQINTLLFFLATNGYIQKSERIEHDYVEVLLRLNHQQTIEKSQKRLELCSFVIDKLNAFASINTSQTGNTTISFSLIEMINDYHKETQQGLFRDSANASIEEMEEALLYLSKIGALKLEGGFLVIYQTMEIQRTKELKLRYKQDDYRLLDEFYKQKMQQIHIVGEYANLMVRNYDAALRYVSDYFLMDYQQFIAKYFKGEKHEQLQRNITSNKYNQLFGTLSPLQREIIDDHASKCIVVAAGPGSGKTRVLVHKLASLLMLEDVKHEQLLMLTFSRAAATEFKKRLLQLIGNAAHFVEIKTFHSYSFDLLGRMGNLEEAKDVVQRAANMIALGEVEPGKISKSVLVIDEAQDMDEHEYALVKALMSHNEEMRVIAVGDDDQNIFQFRGADSLYLQTLANNDDTHYFQMTDNYRSSQQIVAFANNFVARIQQRMKSQPIAAVRQDPGSVNIVRHVGNHFEEALVKQLLSTSLQGSTAILTHTNDEALRILALLRHHKVNCRLVQSLDGFRLNDLAEIRYFLKIIHQHTSSPIISDAVWQAAKEQTRKTYDTSDCLDTIQNIFDTFEHTNRNKYLSDLEEFLYESSIEDFYRDKDAICISTIHKSKGREFDNVFIYLTTRQEINDDYLRQLYVGLTRAKQNLFIHSNSTLFDNLPTTSYTYDSTPYPLPQEVTIQLTHRDVVLDNFRNQSTKQQLLAMRSGDSLKYHNYGLYTEEGFFIAKLSHSQQDSLQQWEQKGYRVASATVRYIVAWQPHDTPEDPCEAAVVLANLGLEIESDLQNC